MHTAQHSLCRQSVCFSRIRLTVSQNKAEFYSRSVELGSSRLRTPVRSVVASSSRGGNLPVVTQPWSSNDVDRDLWAVLDLASDEELEGVHDILFGEQPCSVPLQSTVLRSHHVCKVSLPSEKSCSLLAHSPEYLTVETSLLSPLIKSFLTAREPAALKHRGRAAVMHRIEQRMRFLAVGP